MLLPLTWSRGVAGRLVLEWSFVTSNPTPMTHLQQVAIPPTPSPNSPPATAQAVKHMSLWGPCSFKPPCPCLGQASLLGPASLGLQILLSQTYHAYLLTSVHVPGCCVHFYTCFIECHRHTLQGMCHPNFTNETVDA